MPKSDCPQQAHLRAVAPESSFQILFEHLEGVSFFAKNQRGEIVKANHSFLSRFGYNDEAEIVGKTDFDLFPGAMAEHFRKDDRAVMESGVAKINLVELFPNRQGIPDWFVTNKLPTRSRDGSVIGVMGTVQRYEPGSGQPVAYGGIAPAVEHIKSHFDERLDIGELAAMAGLSVRQFDRVFKQTFNLTPKSFIIKSRIKAACDLLREGEQSISDVAIDLGFYDQSSFTSQFRKEMGITPYRYRRQFRTGTP